MDYLPGSDTPVLVEPCFHEVLGFSVTQTPPGSSVAFFALGCFWGAEKLFWETDGVTMTAVGYMGGRTKNPTYQQVCGGLTGHAETVRVCFDPAKIGYCDLVEVFFENHDPTQGMRQGHDIGSQYRSVIFADQDQRPIAAATKSRYQTSLSAAGYGDITTAIVDSSCQFYFAENYHQGYLAKNPAGYCPVHATGVKCGASKN